MDSWQPRQRRTAGMQAMLFNKLDSLARAHPEWAGYDLLTYLLAALHLIIESDRLTGGKTRWQIIDELATLVALEGPADYVNRHREIAESIIDVLMNSKDRHTRLRSQYLRVSDGAVTHPELSFSLVGTAGDNEATEPTLRATPEAINIFQNLFTFDPSDRAAAERYRSERMLERRDYDEVLFSVERRATSIHGLHGELDRLLRRIRYSVRDVDYATEVIPKLDESLAMVREQIDAEERFADTVGEHAHHHAPDLPRLQRITEHLQALIHSLNSLHRTAMTVKGEFEQEQDRQLLTYRRATINPQSDLFDPLLDAPPTQLEKLLIDSLAVFVSPRAPQIMNLQALQSKMMPVARPRFESDERDPFELGEIRSTSDELDPAVIAAIDLLLSAVTAPTGLQELLDRAETEAELDHLDAAQREQLPWALAIVIASAYGSTDIPEPDTSSDLFDQSRLAVVRTGRSLDADLVSGDDLLIIPRSAPATPTTGEVVWTASTPES